MVQFVLSEKELHRRSQCSLYDPLRVDVLEGPAERTFRWAVLERSFGKIHKAPEIREHFVSGWNKAWSDLNTKFSGDYWKGPKFAAALGRRVYEFLLKFEVIHPFEPYTLELDRGVIHGSNALISWKKARKEPIPMVIDTWLRRPRDVRTPHLPALAQWMAARQQVDTVDLGIVHMPLVFGERWTSSNVDEALARRWLNAIVNEAADKSLFPRVGTQCTNCSHPCKEVFHGPDGHSWD